MLRDERIRAVDELPVTLDIRRPNGSLFRRIVPDERQAGGAVTELELADTPPLGAWSVEARVDRDAEPLARLGLHVAAFIPDRLNIALAHDTPTRPPDHHVPLTQTAPFPHPPP